MRKFTLLLMASILAVVPYSSQLFGANLTLPTGGRVTIELITSDAAFSNTLSLESPNAGIVLTGCEIEPSTGLLGLKLLSEKISQRGCRVELDADPTVAGIQPFAIGDTLEFNFCAQVDADADCDYIWSSDSSDNSDNEDHVITTELYDGDVDVDNRIFKLAWEDQPDLGDRDFNDLIVVVRVVLDSDEDGLWDDWEKFGIDTNGDGIADLVLPGADPQHKDIYIEIDYMDCNAAGGDCDPLDTHSHEPKQDAINEVIQAFANAPVTNPDGIDGVTLHVDVDDAIPHDNTLDMGCFGSSVDFDTIKNDSNFFGPNNPRRFAYHYVIFGHQQVANSTSSGCGEVDGNDFIVTLGAWNYRCSGGANQNLPCPAAAGLWDCPGSTCDPLGDMDGDGDDDQDVGTDRQQAGTLMHELGHNLDLRHGGGDCINYKPNYLSIMSYRFQFSGILPTGRLDYSGDDLDDLDEDNNNLDETVGIGDGTDDTRFNCPNGNVQTGAGTGAIDWNCDGDGGVDPAVTVNINGDCIDNPGDIYGPDCGDCDPGEGPDFGLLTGYDDWENLKYDFQNSDNFQDGRHVDVDVPDMNFKTYMEVINNPPVADAGPDQTLECAGPEGAIVTFKGSGSYDPDDDSLTFTWTGDFGTRTGEVVDIVLPLGTHYVLLTVVDNKGGSASDSVIAIVQDTTPPFIDVTFSPNPLWPPNHKMREISSLIIVEDTCDSGPMVSLIAITSNEPDDGLGDGDFPYDIQDASFGTDDRSFSLRAERSGTGTGRIYTVTYGATDSSGNTANTSATVTVQHDRRENK
jgi:hypothetical protein